MKRRILVLFLPLTLIACVPLQKPRPGLPNLALAQEEKRECKSARVIFPAGLYTPEVQSERGTYYVAPADMRTEGVLFGGGYRGGLFVSKNGRHAAWFGDARDDAGEKDATLIGALGASSPKVWPFSPLLPVTAAPPPP